MYLCPLFLLFKSQPHDPPKNEFLQYQQREAHELLFVKTQSLQPARGKEGHNSPHREGDNTGQTKDAATSNEHVDCDTIVRPCPRIQHEVANTLAAAVGMRGRA